MDSPGNESCFPKSQFGVLGFFFGGGIPDDFTCIMSHIKIPKYINI